MSWGIYQSVRWNWAAAILWFVLSASGCSKDQEPSSATSSAATSDADNPEGSSTDPDLGIEGPADDWAEIAATGGVSSTTLPSCAAQSQNAEVIPVDMHIMLDRSGSMLESTAGGLTKWEAVREALSGFVSEPRSAGLSVALSYFPRGNEGVPETCVSDAACGEEGGPCLTRACLPTSSSAGFKLCIDDDDCPGSSCVPYGVCSGADNLYCFEFGEDGCGAGNGTCLTTSAECLNFATCEPQAYVTPTVDFGELPEHGDTVLYSLRSTDPVSTTPTAAALQGAVTYAQLRARQEPEHKVAVVLATDGLPTGCDNGGVDDVSYVAAQGLADATAIRTYVIGVFSPSETEGPANSDEWARAGGTNSAFIVDPQADLAAEFLEALKRIRYGTVGCEYRVPEAPEGETIDFEMVNVRYVGEESSLSLTYVADASQCGTAQRGWYYDVNPSEGTPSRIKLCDNACNVLSNELGGSVEIYLGCVTQRPL